MIQNHQRQWYKKLTRYHTRYCTFDIRRLALVVDIDSAILHGHRNLAHKLPFENVLHCIIYCIHSIHSFPICTVVVAVATAHGDDCFVDTLTACLANDANLSVDRFDCNCTDRSSCGRPSRSMPSYTRIESIHRSCSDRCERESATENNKNEIKKQIILIISHAFILYSLLLQ